MLTSRLVPKLAPLALLLLGAGSAMAQEETPTLDSGSTAWMLVASVLVLFMTLPGLALFYGGLVRVKNVLSVLVQCVAIAAVMSLLWVAYGYTFAAEAGNAFFGGAVKLFLKGVEVESVSGVIPETVYVMFQMTFAIITPALIVGAFAERMKFIAVLLFTALWFTLSYVPIWHMAWRISDPMGLFAQWGTLDFAGGTVVHINAGIAGLVACLFVGKRKGFRQQILAPHNVPLTVVGAAMLWVGWFGFNAGSQLAADGVAGMAMLVTQLATAAAVVTWMIVEWIKTGKPTAVGVATGAVAGLVAITPASGTCGPMGAIAIGVAAGLGCYLGATVLKNALGYDDSLDVFGVHGIGGIIGALLTGVFASQTLGGNQDIEIGAQVFKQLKSVIVTIVWSGVVSAVVLGILKVTIGLRASEQAEIEGLDSADHGESGYSLH